MKAILRRSTASRRRLVARVGRWLRHLRYPVVPIRALCKWLVLTWRPIDIKTLPKVSPCDYPTRLAALHFEAGITEIRDQNSQGAVLDTKLAVASGTSLTVVLLLWSSLSAIDDALGEWMLGRWLILIGALVLVFAFANGVRGLWTRRYRALPDLSAIRERLAEQTTDEDARWSISVPVEQAVAVNERVIQTRLAAVRVTYLSMVLGIAAIILAGAPHFVAEILTPERPELNLPAICAFIGQGCQR